MAEARKAARVMLMTPLLTLFADLVSSTELVARLDAEDAMRRLKPALDAMCEAVERSCRRTGRPMGSMMSYAGHDASVLGLNVRTGMVFVPSTGGITVRMKWGKTLFAKMTPLSLRGNKGSGLCW